MNVANNKNTILGNNYARVILYLAIMARFMNVKQFSISQCVFCAWKEFFLCYTNSVGYVSYVPFVL